MIRRIKLAAKLFLPWTRGNRNVTVFPDDIFIVSYPRSGNTWLRFLIGNLLYENDPITFANIEQKIPDIYQNSEKELLRIPRPRLLKSHEYFDPRYKKVIYVVRDPRDVAVSYYHFKIKMKSIDEQYPIEEFVSRFIRGELDQFGSWGENVGSWIGAKPSGDGFLLIRYEDMLQDSYRELHKIGSFLNIDVNDRNLNRALELSTADHMRLLEQRESKVWKPIKKSRKDKRFVRCAKADGWKAELSDSLATKIMDVWGQLMNRLGYSN